MKQTKKLSILAAGAFAVGLLLGTSAAQAALVTDGPVDTGITISSATCQPIYR